MIRDLLIEKLENKVKYETDQQDKTFMKPREETDSKKEEENMDLPQTTEGQIDTEENKLLQQQIEE